MRALSEDGKEHPFAIQELTLPMALAGDDLIGQARTGMGKTLAFGVPMLQRITTDPERELSGIPRALVVVPTRELCIQVFSDLAIAAKYLTAGDRKLTVTSIYGGRPYEPQIEALQKGVDVVVGTPGRLLDLAQQGHLQLGGLSMLVLDEADEMLDLGFLPDIERILRQIPDGTAGDAVLGDHAGPDHHAGPHVHEPAHPYPGGGSAFGGHPRHHRAVRVPRARTGQGRAGHPDTAGQRPRRDDDLHPHQAHRAEGLRRARRARLQGRRGTR